jgi:cysteine protease ATG4
MENNDYTQKFYSLYSDCKTQLVHSAHNFIEQINNNVVQMIYPCDDDEKNNNEKNNNEKNNNEENNKEDKNTKINQIYYFPYRYNFPVPLANNATNDIGWGCMVRTGQMMLCETFKKIENMKDTVKCIPELFLDIPSAPFSIHNITTYGAKYNIPVGEQFPDTELSLTLQDLLNNSIINNYINIVAVRERIIYKDQVNAILNNNKQCLLLIPVMLGLENINEIYYSQINKLLQHDTSVGFIGGIQKKSLYLTGIQETKLEYLDPHMIKSALINIKNDNQTTKIIGEIELLNLNSSMMLCFLIKSKDQFNEWSENILDPSTSDMPIFCFSETQEKHNTVNTIDLDDEWSCIV